MLVKFNQLMLEITRRCGMQCAHCMRGDAQDMEMDSNVLETLMLKTTYIEHLGITGGEPSLAPGALKQLVYYANHWNCHIGSFFCATNAENYSDQFIETLNALYHLCEKPNECILTISTDQFHDKANPKALEEYRKLPYYKPVKEKGSLPESEILNEGRAAENGIGTFSTPEIPYLYDTEMQCFNLWVGDRVYINAKGNVLLDADCSYANQEDLSIGNIMTTSLPDMLLSNAFHIPESWYGKDKTSSVYCLHFKADAHTVANLPIEDRRYFPTAKKASAAYHNAVHNLFLTPVNLDCGTVPDGLRLSSEELKSTDYRCAGTVISYRIPENDTVKTVTIELLRCPMEEEFDDVRDF